MSGICCSDFQVGALLVALKSEEILPLHHLNSMYYRVVFRYLSLEILFEWGTVRVDESDGSCNIEVVEEAGNV